MKSCLSNDFKVGLVLWQIFPTALTTNPTERAMYSCVNLVIALSLPASWVANRDLREFSKFSEHISINSFKYTLFKLEELVEAKIRTEKKATKGAIMYDGWSVNGTHYLGIMAVYMKSVKYRVKGFSSEKRN